jgi:hypothetical protein
MPHVLFEISENLRIDIIRKVEAQNQFLESIYYNSYNIETLYPKDNLLEPVSILLQPAMLLTHHTYNTTINEDIIPRDIRASFRHEIDHGGVQLIRFRYAPQHIRVFEELSICRIVLHGLLEHVGQHRPVYLLASSR